MPPGMEDTHRRHLQGLTRTTREARPRIDARYGHYNAERTAAAADTSPTAVAASESVNPVNSPSPTT